MTVDAMGILLGSDLEVEPQLRWAVHLAAARKMDLLVLHRVESPENQTVDLPLDGPPNADGTIVAGEILNIAESSLELSAGARPEEQTGPPSNDERHRVHVTLRQIRCPNPRALRQQLLDEIGRSKLKLFTIARRELETNDVELVRERRMFLRHVPCDVVFCFGLEESTDLSRILVAIASGPHGSSALRLGADLAAHVKGRLTALRVNPDIGQDAARVGARRLDSVLKKTMGKEYEEVHRQVVVDDQIHRGVRQVWEDGRHGLVVLGASRLGVLGSQIGRGFGGKLLKGEDSPVVAVVSAGSPITNRLLGMVEGGIERFVPQIDRDDRVSLVDRVQSSSQWDFDFFALMVLSTIIAAIGLIQSSAAVVIGAMLVAPLMTPLLGMGVALIQGNPVLARISFRAILLGLAVSLLVGALVGLATPGFDEPTREMLGRGGPGLLDLFVAFASGLAAAYASSRPGLLAALPGVAIAAALVPPIATSGLALSLGNLHLAAGALLLFVINMVTIVLASTASLWVVGLRSQKRTSRWTVVAGSAFVVSVLALGVYLAVQPKQNPAATELPPSLIRTMQDRLGDDYRLDSLAVAYDELGVQLNLRVVGESIAPEELAHEVRELAREHFEQPVRVRLLTEIEAVEIAP